MEALLPPPPPHLPQGAPHDDDDDKAHLLEPIPLDRVTFGDAHHHHHHIGEGTRRHSPHPDYSAVTLGSHAAHVPADTTTHTAPPAEPGRPTTIHIVVRPSDVLCGRGARVNAQPGNVYLRAACATHRAAWDAANLPAKQRLTADIVESLVQQHECRFLKAAPAGEGGWVVLSRSQARRKAAQVLRDLARGNRPGRRPTAAARPIPPPLPPIVELPTGVQAADVLGGRGAWINEHAGNQSWRRWAAARRAAFLAASYADKRSLAVEIVRLVQAAGGRFIKRSRVDEGGARLEDAEDDETATTTWEELSHDQAIQKTCQVMRDIRRPDRVEREERRRLRKVAKAAAKAAPAEKTAVTEAPGDTAVGATSRPNDNPPLDGVQEEIPMVAMTKQEEEIPSDVVDQAVADAAEALHQQLEDKGEPPEFNGQTLYAPEVAPLAAAGLLAGEGDDEVTRWI